jgi:hypothetical protein
MFKLWPYNNLKIQIMNINNVISSISIIELEERFETSVFALDAERCGDRARVEVELQ